LAVPGADLTQASGINNLGQIVGVDNAGTGPSAFLYTDGNYTKLNIPDANANSINDLGQIVGEYSLNNFATVTCFLYSKGHYTTLSVPGADDTYVYGINDFDQVVGQYYVGSVAYGFLYSKGHYTTLSIPGASYTGPYGINNFDKIVGGYIKTSAVPELYTWTMMLFGFVGLGLVGYRKGPTTRRARTAATSLMKNGPKHSRSAPTIPVPARGRTDASRWLRAVAFGSAVVRALGALPVVVALTWASLSRLPRSVRGPKQGSKGREG
jgi:probable HAF family extracellular repeat protein